MGALYATTMSSSWATRSARRRRIIETVDAGHAQVGDEQIGHMTDLQQTVITAETRRVCSGRPHDERLLTMPEFLQDTVIFGDQHLEAVGGRTRLALELFAGHRQTGTPRSS